MISLLNVTKIAALAVALAISNTGHANPENFTVHSVTGTNIFTLDAAKGKFVALHFLLKTECPYCIRHTHEYAQKAAADSNVTRAARSEFTRATIRKSWVAIRAVNNRSCFAGASVNRTNGNQVENPNTGSEVAQ